MDHMDVVHGASTEAVVCGSDRKAQVELGLDCWVTASFLGCISFLGAFRLLSSPNHNKHITYLMVSMFVQCPFLYHATF